MVLQIISREVEPTPDKPKPGSKDFKKWYEKNKLEFNKARALKYQQNSAYRERQHHYKRLRIKPDPVGCVTLTELAEELGITIWVLNEWRKKDYFPAAFAYKGSRWVRKDNIGLLQALKEHFEKQGRRISRANEGALHDLRQWIFENWKEQE